MLKDAFILHRNPLAICFHPVHQKTCFLLSPPSSSFFFASRISGASHTRRYRFILLYSRITELLLSPAVPSPPSNPAKLDKRCAPKHEEKLWKKMPRQEIETIFAMCRNLIFRNVLGKTDSMGLELEISERMWMRQIISDPVNTNCPRESSLITDEIQRWNYDNYSDVCKFFCLLVCN